MKPSNWNKMSQKDKTVVAGSLAASMRGQLILAQALAVAIETMSKEPEERREVSNIQDMEMLLEGLFPAFAEIIAISRKNK